MSLELEDPAVEAELGSGFAGETERTVRTEGSIRHRPGLRTIDLTVRPAVVLFPPEELVRAAVDATHDGRPLAEEALKLR